MHRRPTGVAARSLSQLLDETFGIYGRHFWRLVGLVAVVQAPMNLIALVPLSGMAGLAYNSALNVAAGVVVFAAVTVAVGQHYVADEVSIGRCYLKTWWRVASLFGVTLSVVVIGAAVAGPGLTPGNTVAGTLLSIVALVAVVIAVYWSVAVPAVILEGRKPVGALRRSFRLVRGSWWRVLGITFVLGLVAIGLSLLVFFPFLIASVLAAGPDGVTTLSRGLEQVGGAFAAIAVLPVLFIAETLLYYDLRVRKEEYDLEALTREMGIVALSPNP